MMTAAIEIILLGIAILLDLWIGNIGAMPMFSCYFACHWCGIAGPTAGVSAALISGVLLDLVYGRITPFALWILPAAVLAAFFTMPPASRRYSFLRAVLLPGAAAGAVIGIGRCIAPICFGASPPQTLYLAEMIIWSTAFGALFFAAVVRFLDMILKFLGLTGFCSSSRQQKGRTPQKKRLFKVRGSSVRKIRTPRSAERKSS